MGKPRFFTLLSQQSDRIKNSDNFCDMAWFTHQVNTIKPLYQNFGRWVYSLSEQVNVVLVSLFFEFDISINALLTKANCANYKLNYDSKITFKFKELDLSLSDDVSLQQRAYISELFNSLQNPNYNKKQKENSIIHTARNAKTLLTSFFVDSLNNIQDLLEILKNIQILPYIDKSKIEILNFQKEIVLSLFITAYYYKDHPQFPNIIHQYFPYLTEVVDLFSPKLRVQIISFLKDLPLE